MSLTRSIDQPLFTPIIPVNKSTMSFQSDLMRLRDLRKAEKLPEEINREEILFGEIDTFDKGRVDRKLTSRNKLVGRHTYNFQSEVEDIDHIPDDHDSMPEEDFDLDINEHDEEILLKSVNIHHKDINNQKYGHESKELKPSLILPSTGLEVIKETDDVNISPNKINISENKLKIPLSKKTATNEAKGAESHKFGLKSSSQNIDTKISRRNTVSLKPPTILNGPKSITNASKLQNQAKIQTKIDKSPISPFSGKRFKAEAKVESQTSRADPKSKSSNDAKIGFSQKAKLVTTQK